MKRKLFSLSILLISFNAFAQTKSFDDKAKGYVQKFAAWAIEEQQRVGIPAAITLAQGIYETGAGESELATKANNHFGIKCKKEWRGETFAHTDDAPNECFRKYQSAKESYIDHSNYLKNSVRYAELFDYEKTNYVAWAKGLKKCGYATNPAYAQKLIKMVEDYDLQQYTLAASGLRNNEVVPSKEDSKTVVVKSTNIEPLQSNNATNISAESNKLGQANDAVEGATLFNGLRAVYCHKGETLLERALKYNIRYARLLEINELADEPLKRDMYVYLEPKNNKGAHITHLVQEGETIEIIAHNEGMNSRQLRVFNLLAQNEQPVAGSLLKLQEQSDDRPSTYKMVKIVEEKKTDNVRLVDANQNKSDDFIETKKSNQQVEEIAIGYGAEPPVLEESKSVVKQNAVKNIEKPSPSTNEKIENKSAAEPQDEFSLLKAKLDKSVYARSTKSNIKVSSSDSSAVFSTPTVDARQINSNTIVSSGTDKTKQDANAVYHTVVKGETGYSIAKKYGIKIQQLNEWNALDFGGIKIGQKLRVK